jgi:hypothetical protein
VLQTYGDGTPKTRHVTSNVFVDVNEDAGTAIGRAYFTVFQALPDFRFSPSPPGAIATGSSATRDPGASPRAR